LLILLAINSLVTIEKNVPQTEVFPTVDTMRKENVELAQTHANSVKLQ